jgi:ferredoxin
MRVVVDASLCEGHGKCALAAPEVFVLGDDDRSHVRPAEVAPDLREKVEQAIRLCPRQAIRWMEEP